MTIQPGPALTTSSTITIPLTNGWSETFTTGDIFPEGVTITMPTSGVGVTPAALWVVSGAGLELISGMRVVVAVSALSVVNDGDTICPLASWGASGPGYSYLPMIPTSECSIANRAGVAFVISIFTTTFWLTPGLTAVYPISGPGFPSMSWV